MAPKYSIVMPTYNGEKYLVAQIESILLQTIPDFELIISDDHSSDNTFCVAKSYEAKDIRIKIFRNDTNLGFKKNIEKVIGLCGGVYLAF